MVQFYFLAVCLNIIGGLVLAAPSFKEKIPFLSSMRAAFVEKQSGRIIFVLVLLFTGIFKILSVTKGDVPIVGDLLPALSLFVLAFTFMVEFFAEKSTVEGSLLHTLEDIFVRNSQIIGVSAVVIGVFHFIFPGVLFL